MGWRLRSGLDGVDPLGAGIGLIALAVSLWSVYQSVRAWRLQETNVADLVTRLVDAVAAVETSARAQLLGRHDKPIDVHFDFRPAPAHDAQQADPQGRLGEVVDYYQRLRPRRMVITGEPGSGKTVLAIEIILGLLGTRRSEDPVPVRLSAATWSTDTAEPIQHWLINHLVATFDLSPVSAEALVIGQKILPVIDGLDEMDATATPGYDSRAGRALEALNTYQHHRAKAELLLTCRTHQYQALQTARVWAQEAAHIQLRPVDPVQARAFLTDRVIDLHRWEPVLDILDHLPSHPLTMALSTPWRLTLATTVYEQRHPGTGAFLRDPADLTRPPLTHADSIREHLLSLFIPATLAIQDPIGTARYRAEEVHRWLATLATYLNTNTSNLRRLGGRVLSGADIVLHELWPLAGPLRLRLLTTLTLTVPFILMFAIVFRAFQISHSIVDGIGVGLIAFLTGRVAAKSWLDLWPDPWRLDLTLLVDRKSRRQVTMWIVLLIVGVIVSAFASGLAVGLAIGFAGLVMILLSSGLASSGLIGARDSQALVRNDLASALIFALLSGLAIGPVIGAFEGTVIGLMGGLVFGLVFGFGFAIALGLALGLVGGLVGVRYVALILLTRFGVARPLPWRLARFLNWCYQAGLVRIAGVGYQFRHRELQDYLARHPQP